MASSRKRAIDSDDDSSSDDELDEQLLSLSSKKAKNSPTVAAKKMADSDSDKDENSDSSTDDSDNEWTLDSEGNGKSNNKKKNGKTQKPTPAKRRASTVSDEEEDGEINDDEDNEEEEKEEGQVMSSSSSSDDDGSDEDLPAFDDGLDANLIGDEEDRLKLEEMTEKDREIELYNRMEKREAMKVRLEIERKLHGKRKTERKQHKKEKDKKSGDDNKSKEPEVYNSSIASRKGERKKTVEDVKKKAINELKQKRIEKKEKMEALMSKKEPLTTKDVYSDDDDDDDDDDDEDDNKEEEDSDKSSVEFASDDEDAEEERLSQQIETREQLEDIRLSRHKLEQWVHLPFFTRVISGCFLRMGIGNHDGRAIYRVAEIIDVTETSKVYNLGKTRTNKGVKVRHGLQERIFRMEYVSNQAFTDSEFQKWKEEMKLVELPLPTLRQVKEKSADISTSKAYSYKDDDIEAIVKEKNKFRKNPFNYAVKKNRLIREKEIAEQTNDFKKLEKVKVELDELEERAQMLDKKRSGALSNVSFINERNRKKNVYDAEKACIEEGRQNKEKKDDPFTRRKTQPKMIIKSTAQEQKTDESINSEAQDTSTGEFAEPAPELDSLLFKSELTVSGVNKSSDDADLFTAHDFDVQIDVPIPAARTISLTPKPMVHQRENVSRRSLNLDEYKKRKGLM